ncbi:RIO2 family protein [Clostridium hydrogenum]|uniref:serine/threonine protein kinase n=1 Tax=Clostridium hydrogenum TaxID=2855764 RepID=UPI001F4891F8|nr:serine/threonine protein kinase [Clostridium hydrogenum]
MKEKGEHNNTIIKLDNCIFLGKGHSGSVYLMPDGRALKIFKDPDTCKEEYRTLERLKNGPYFPQPLEFHNHYMIREYISGKNIKTYIKENGFSYELALKIINFLDYIIKSGFKKIDVRFAHIFLENNGSFRVIDPRNSYTRKKSYPNHLIGDLKDEKLLHDFFKVLEDERPDLYKKWK